MNSWNFNEVTQGDLYDFKACKHNQTGKIYGIKDSSDCQSGKEIDTKDINEMVRKANKGDLAAKKQLEEYRKAKAKGKQETAKEKEEQERKKKEAADPKKKKGKGKKGGGKGKKGGGKGKGGKGGKGAKGGKGGGGKAAPATQKSTAQSQAQVRQRQVESARRGAKALQDALGSIKNPKQRERIEKKIADLLESVAKLTMPNAPTPEAPQAPAQQQQQPAKKENEKS